MHRKRSIDRYLAAGLSHSAEERLRRHLAACDACRAYYDQQVLLQRALAGGVTQPTRQENDRTARRAIAAIVSGASEPSAASQTAPTSTTSRASAGSLPRWVVPAIAVVLLAMGIWSLHALLRPTRVAHLGQSRAVAIDGVAAADHAAIRTGAILAVGAHGLARIELNAGGEIRVFPTTRLSFSHAGNVLELTRGKVWCVVEGHRGGFAVQTADAVARVTGTSFVVQAEAGTTDVRVMKGAVRVQGTGSAQTVTVRADEQTRVVHGRPPQPVEHYAVRIDQAQWSRFVHEVLHRIEHGVRKGVRRLQRLLK